MAIELTTVTTETALDLSSDKSWFNDVSETPDAINQTLLWRLSQVKGADIASASTVNFDTSTGDLVDVTGTTTITAITLSEGRKMTVRFTGVLTLTHGTSLVLPTAANITTAAGDYAEFRGYSGGVVRCVRYQRYDGTALAGSTPSGTLTTYRTVYSFTDAQIKASPTTPLTLCSAPGANKLIVFQGADIIRNWTSVYTNIDAAGYARIQYTTANDFVSTWLVNDTTPGVTGFTKFLSSHGTGEKIYRMMPYTRVDTTGYYDLMAEERITVNTNDGLEFYVDNGGSGNLTGGNAANTLKIAVKWDVWDLS